MVSLDFVVGFVLVIVLGVLLYQTYAAWHYDSVSKEGYDECMLQQLYMNVTYCVSGINATCSPTVDEYCKAYGDMTTRK